MGRVGFHLFPQAANVHHECILISDQRPVPQRCAQGIYGHDVSPCLPQLFQQGKFLCRERDFLAVPSHSPLAPVDLGVSQFWRIRILPIDSPQHGAQTEQQFLR